MFFQDHGILQQKQPVSGVSMYLAVDTSVVDWLPSMGWPDTCSLSPYIHVYTNDSWTATKVNTGDGTFWYSISPAFGTGNGIVTVSWPPLSSSTWTEHNSAIRFNHPTNDNSTYVLITSYDASLLDCP